MRLLWEDRAWSDYLYWQTQDKKTLKRINGLIKVKCTLCQGHYDFSFSDFYFIFVCCVEASK